MNPADFMRELVAAFQGEAEDLVQAASQEIMKLEGASGLAERKDCYQKLGRSLHTLKGSAATCQLLDVAELAHKLEDRLASFKASGEPFPPEAGDLFLQSLDVARSRVRRHAKGEGGQLGLLKLELPALYADGDNAAASTVAAPPEAATAADEAPAIDEELPAESSWRVDPKVIVRLMREVERLREINLGLKDKGRDLTKLAAVDSIPLELRSRLDMLRGGLAHEGEALGLAVELLEEHLRSIYAAPAIQLLAPLQRLVRDQCRESGKLAKLSLLGGELALDRRVLEALKGPLVHLLRNAVDHGVETPAERDARGKHSEAALLLRLEQQGNLLHIEVADDGDGLRPQKLREHAVKKGLLTREVAAALSDDEAIQLIYRSGFSTKDQVSKTSGRGVGMDVVKAEVQRLRGSLEVKSVPQQGTRWLIIVPLELGASPLLMLRCGRAVVALPLLSVESALAVSTTPLKLDGTQPRAFYQDQWWEISDLGHLLQLNQPGVPEAGQSLLVIQAQGRKRIVRVDESLGDAELVIQPLPEELIAEKAYQGCALYLGAELVMVLKPEWIIERGAQAPARTGKRALVVDDSLTARAMHRAALESGGWQVHATASGAQAMDLLSRTRYDAVVCDIGMENMDGYEFTRQLRAGAAGAPSALTPVLLVSMHDGEAERALGVAAGADAFLSKRDCAAGRLLAEVERLGIRVGG